jgi:carboxyl-terminal processing protease
VPPIVTGSAPAVPAAALPPPDPREAALSATVIKLLEQEHLLHKKIDDDVSRAAFKTYLDRLDGGKMFLLTADRSALEVHADKIDDQLRSGSLDLAHEGAKIFAARVAVVDKLTTELLAAPMDFTNEEFLEIDPDKTELAATEQELRERWRRRLELEVLERVAQMEARLEPPKKDPKKKGAKKPDAIDEDRSAMPIDKIPKTPEGREAKAREDLAKTYSGRFARLRTPAKLDAAADVVNAVSAALDPHTLYLPPSDKANFDIQMSGSLEGIGAVLRERDHYIEIVELVPGGAAWRQGGVAQGDLILAVAADGKEPIDVVDMRIDEVVKMIRGPKNTRVTLRVQKPAGTEDSVTITRDKVVLEEAYAKGAVLSKKGRKDVGYIHLPSFYGGRGSPRTAAGDVRKLLAEMRTRKVAGVILDLRSNGGGILGDAVEMTGDLIDSGPVVQVQDSRMQREVHDDDKQGFEYEGPVIVMVDRFSASASEIVAGALQDYGRALIVGTSPTHGKGTVQTLADLDRGGSSDLGVLKITIQQFFRVSGSSTQREGVTPDILLPDPTGHLETGERELDHAIAWSQIPAAAHDKWQPTWNVATLAQSSAARVAKNPMLSKIATTVALLRERQKDTRVPLARTAWDARRKAQRAALEAASPDLSTMPVKLSVKTIEDPAAPPPVAPGPGGKTDDRAQKWRDSLARDPWLEESVNILAEMHK